MITMTINFVDLCIIVFMIVYFIIAIFKAKTYSLTTFFTVSALLFLMYASNLFRMLMLAAIITKIFELDKVDFFKLFKNKDTEENSNSTEEIEAIVQATSDMAKSKTGALIVVAKDDNDIGKFGIPINADISRELLENLFVPNTPLHDGAVVLTENGQISSAGSVIPLSEEDDDVTLPQDAGTRHRAALSASKQDNVGICVLVSEERGDINIAIDGRMYSDLSEEDLKNILVKYSNINSK